MGQGRGFTIVALLILPRGRVGNLLAVPSNMYELEKNTFYIKDKVCKEL